MTVGTVLAIAGFFMYSHFKMQKMRAGKMGEGLPVQGGEGELLLRKISGDAGPSSSGSVEIFSSGDRKGSPERRSEEKFRASGKP
jgi:hypothetical protein